MERFNKTPWMAAYLQNQNYDDFWKYFSMDEHYKNITLPFYAVSGHFHPNRDSAFSMYEVHYLFFYLSVSFTPHCVERESSSLMFF